MGLYSWISLLERLKSSVSRCKILLTLHRNRCKTFPFLPREYLVHPHAILWYLCPGLHCFYCLRNPNRVDWAPTQGLWWTLHSYLSTNLPPPPQNNWLASRDILKVILSLTCLWASFQPQTPLSAIFRKVRNFH